MPRITLGADNDFNHTLEGLVKSTPATSKAEVIRNAVAVYRFLKSALRSENGMQFVEIEDAKGAKS